MVIISYAAKISNSDLRISPKKFINLRSWGSVDRKGLGASLVFVPKNVKECKP